MYIKGDTFMFGRDICTPKENPGFTSSGSYKYPAPGKCLLDKTWQIYIIFLLKSLFFYVSLRVPISVCERSTFKNVYVYTYKLVLVCIHIRVCEYMHICIDIYIHISYCSYPMFILMYKEEKLPVTIMFFFFLSSCSPYWYISKFWLGSSPVCFLFCFVFTLTACNRTIFRLGPFQEAVAMGFTVLDAPPDLILFFFFIFLKICFVLCAFSFPHTLARVCASFKAEFCVDSLVLVLPTLFREKKNPFF